MTLARYVVAGYAGKPTNEVFRFHIASATWDQVDSAYLRARSVCTSASLGGLGPAGAVLVFGGEVAPSDKGHDGAGAFVNDLVLLDAGSGAPMDVSLAPGELPCERGWAHGAAVPGGRGLLVVGGLSGSDENPTRLADMWRVDFTEAE